ncbi:MAG: hypothetical protein B7Z54_05025 [Sphingobacteriales bacterium 12-47-4]|nr:MAG: hypothetical protein B7Z54_05025 [Sphingobacteriales bacterium 12-47-4]
MTDDGVYIIDLFFAPEGHPICSPELFVFPKGSGGASYLLQQCHSIITRFGGSPIFHSIFDFGSN